MAQISPLELFVKSFIRTHRRASVETHEIQDSIDLIDLKLSKPESTQLVIPIRSKAILTNAVLGYLNDLSKHRYRVSITAARQLLASYL
jgi:hypothetical protein